VKCVSSYGGVAIIKTRCHTLSATEWHNIGRQQATSLVVIMVMVAFYV
jgi:hypothetical protein